MTGNRLKIALIGCGQIADAHLQELRKIPGAEPVAVCDRYIDLAEQAALRFGVPGVYSDLGQMLEAVRPDVLHITTPPHTHCGLALQAMAAGAHVYVEKPFTVDAVEADRILDAATTHKRLVCVGHDHLFDPVWLDCRALYESGALGRVVHVDSIQGYDLGGPFGKALVSEPDHWVHRLPGGLFQNVMSHALYRITDFMPDERPELWATWFGSSSAMSSPTEMRVMMRGADMTAHLMFSSVMRPVQRVARIYGTRASVEVDLDGRTLRSYRALRMPGPFAKIEAPFRHLREAGRTLGRSLRSFARNEIHYFSGMNRLFTLFYKAIREGGELPTPSHEIRRLTAIMDRIFHGCAWAGAKAETDVTRQLVPLDCIAGRGMDGGLIS
jgi:predicted dehydrogenase